MRYADPIGVGSYFKHHTPDEVPSLFISFGSGTADLIAETVAHVGADNVVDQCGVSQEMADAIVEYVKPRWPELF